MENRENSIDKTLLYVGLCPDALRCSVDVVGQFSDEPRLTYLLEFSHLVVYISWWQFLY